MAVNNVLSVSAPFSLSNYNHFEPPLPKTQIQTNWTRHSLSLLPPPPLKTHSLSLRHGSRNPFVLACSTSTPPDSVPPPSRRSSKKLYVSGLSFRTTEESLRNAFKDFGQLVEVNLVMDKMANRPRGFAFLRYATEEESQRAIEGMHGKFLDGRVIFVEVAKPRSELRQGLRQNPRQY